MAPECSDKTQKEPVGEVIDLLLSDSDSDCDDNEKDTKELKQSSDSNDKDNCRSNRDHLPAYKKILAKTAANAKKAKATNHLNARTKTTTSLGLQAGLVLEEDIFAADSNNDNDGDRKTPPNVLFEDPEFGPMASSIQGMHKASIADASEDGKTPKWRPKCRCSLLSTLSYNNDGRPYFSCGKHSNAASQGRKCNFFSWAFRAELIPWYRFGSHNGHVLVHKDLVGAIAIANASTSTSTPSIFSAQDLVQGKVGDCWFLSALAVVAERSDLVGRLFRRKPGRLQNDREDERRGIVRVNLFLDGIWTPVTIDNFLPCSLGGGSRKEEEELQKAIEASLLDQSSNSTTSNIRNPYAKPKNTQLSTQYNTEFPRAASENDPHGLSETNLRVMRAAYEFLQKDFARRRHSGQLHGPQFLPEGRHASTSDLAYSKTRRNQLWVPFLEKAYAKIHGSYQAISGGHVAEAFLDLTGAPTLQVVWHAGRAAAARNSCVYDNPRKLWEDLKAWRRKRLPMGCGTDRSAGGLIGMHAYSILDVVELTNVDVEFFRERLLNGTLGNVSGFTEYDGKLRLLRVRNPHGQGEWKGEFSDKCKTWQKLLMSSGISLPRTMANDGTFWIGYDDFLLGFSNIDVVLAFEGNHAKSFVSNFPPKKSNHRCQRAFEVSLLDPQPGLETKDKVEVYVMGIQKSKRGARQGRVDRKKSYKVSDLGIIVGEYPLDEANNDGGKHSNDPFSTIHGQMFGFNRNGHYKLMLDRRKCKRLVVMPISFGHPAATDEFRSFVVRFNADAPLMIRELEHTPRMDRVLGRFLMSPKPSGHLNNTRQGMQYILWKNANYKVTKIDCLGNGGGTVFVYLCRLADTSGKKSSADGSATSSPITLGIEATCRGMSCRVAEGLLDHETTAKGKKFQASWRKYTTTFVIEANSNIQSRLLMTLYQSGQDTEMGTITCKSMGNVLGSSESNATTSMTSTTLDKFWSTKETPMEDMDYKELGVFNPISMNNMDFRKSRWGSNDIFESKAKSHHEVDVPKDLEDNELEMALALSRMNSTTNANSDLSTEDAELQKALALSREDTGTVKTNTVIDLEDGKETTITRKSNIVESTIDLTADAEVVASSTNNGNVSEKNNVVLDLTDSQVEVVPTISNGGNNTATVLDLIDSSDDEDGESIKEPKVDSEATHEAPSSDSKKRGMDNDSNNDSREKKRKLAAEAALRRMKK